MRKQDGTHREGARRRASGLSTLVLILVACGEAPDAVAPDALADVAPAQSSVGPPGGDLQGIEQLATSFGAAWTAGSAAGYAALYAPDADFVNPIGVVIAGRPAIQAVHTALLAGPGLGSTLSATVHAVNFLTGTVALVDVFTTLSNAPGPPPPFAVISPDGAVRARARWLVMKRGGEWQILSAYHRGWGH